MSGKERELFDEPQAEGYKLESLRDLVASAAERLQTIPPDEDGERSFAGYSSRTHRYFMVQTHREPHNRAKQTLTFSTIGLDDGDVPVDLNQFTLPANPLDILDGHQNNILLASSGVDLLGEDIQRGKEISVERFDEINNNLKGDIFPTPHSV